MLTRRKLLFSGMAGTAVVCPVAGAWIAGSMLSAPCPQAVGALPADLKGLDVEIESTSGSKLRAWFVPGRPGAGGILLLHGLRANRLKMLARARFLNRAGYSVLLIDFQAHGESPGSKVTFGYLESRDARAAVDFLRRTLPGEKVAIIGASMGGAAAVLASPALGVDAMVLEGVYTTIEKAIENRLKDFLGSWGGVLTPALSAQLRPRLGVSAAEICPVQRIAEIAVPKLIIAGGDDHRTTLEDSHALFDAAKGPKELWIVPGAGHVDLHKAAGAEYERRILAFLESTLRK